MSLGPGDTLRIVDHLCVVISDPAQDPDEIVLVALTTRESWKEEACVLYSGDHPFVEHDTCVDYAIFNEFFTLAQLRKALATGKAKQRESVTPEVLSRILTGARESRRIPMAFLNLLTRQGLLD